MKVKDWIKELEKIDSEKQLYFRQRGSNGEDWGFIIVTPSFKTQPLEKIERMKVTFTYPEEGRKNAKALGECATLELGWY